MKSEATGVSSVALAAQTPLPARFLFLRKGTQQIRFCLLGQAGEAVRNLFAGRIAPGLPGPWNLPSHF